MKPEGKLNGPLELRGYSDADYSGDNVTRKSATGYIVIINEVVITRSLISNKTVTIYVTEADY